MALEHAALVSPGHLAMGLEDPLDRFEVQVPAPFDDFHRRARLCQAGFRQRPLIRDGTVPDTLDLVVCQPFGQIHEVAGGGAAHIEA